MRDLAAAYLSLALLLTACSSGSSQSSQAPSSPPGFVLDVVAHGRFTVLISTYAVARAKSVDVDLIKITEATLVRIDQLLPGPKATITIRRSSELVPETGTAGETAPDGLVTDIGFGAIDGLALREVLDTWLPRTLAHEVHHQLRLQILGYHGSLLDALVGEGTASLFDMQVFSGPTDPGVAGLTAAGEHTLWSAAQHDLDSPNRTADWMFGSAASGIPHDAGYTIGYHIAAAYFATHPSISQHDLAVQSSEAILAGSDYNP